MVSGLGDMICVLYQIENLLGGWCKLRNLIEILERGQAKCLQYYDFEREGGQAKCLQYYDFERDGGQAK